MNGLFMKNGIITIATGPKKYIDMAIALGISMSLNSPDIPTAIITDSDNPMLNKLFNIIIKPLPGYSGFQLKTSLHELTPFDQTIFIDSDCLVMSDLNEIFKKCEGRDFIVVGDEIESGFWYTDIPSLLNKIRCASLPKFNSGFIYFEKNKKSKKIFQEANAAFKRKDYYNIESFKNSCPDEPCIAIGMAKAGVSAYTDGERRFSYTPIGLIGKFHVDVFKGKAQWTTKNKGKVSPIIVHFVSRVNCQEYRTECLKLRMLYLWKFNKNLISIISYPFYYVIAFRRYTGFIYHKYILNDL